MNHELQGSAYDPHAAGHERVGRVGPLLPYIFRWKNHGRQGQPCRVTARSRRQKPVPAPEMIAFGWPAPKNFNSIRVEFADGFAMVTSGNAIRKAAP